MYALTTDPEEFLSQLAQLTQVQQLTNIANSMSDLTKSGQQGSIAQWLSTVGKKVETQGNVLSTGDKVTLQPSGDFDQITLTLTNVNTGNMKQVTLNKGDSLTYTYQDQGNVLVGASAVKNGRLVPCQSTVGRVVHGVQAGDSGVQIVLGDGTTMAVTAITKITE